MAKEILIPDEIIRENEELLKKEEVPETQQAEPLEKTVPLSALQKEREEKRRYRDQVKNLRTICDSLMAATGVKNLQQLSQLVENADIVRNVRKRGLTGNVAKEWAEMERENRNFKRGEVEKGLEREVSALSENPFYGDIDDVRDEVLSFAKEKGISVKEAYLALFGEKRSRFLQDRAREDAVAEKEARDKKKIHALASGGAASSGGSLNLSGKELEIAKAAGISPAEYAKFKGGNY